MRKIFLLIIFLYSDVSALERVSTIKMYHGIFNALSAKHSFSIYTDDREYIEVFKYSKRIVLANRPEEAEIVLITNERTLKNILNKREKNNNSKLPLLFVTHYQLLELSEDIVGAFYWRKGRSQLLFIKKRLDAHQIKLPQAYQNFMIDEL